MPWTFILYMIAGFSISGVPLFSGFVSKTMIIAAAGESHRAAIWLMLTLAASGTFLSTTLKLPYAAFLAEDRHIPAKDPPPNMLWGMGLAAFLCILIGLYPKILYDVLPYPVDYVPYSSRHVVEELQLLLFTGLGFLVLLKRLHPERTITLDLDWFYRMGGRGFLWLANHPVVVWENFVGEMYKTMVLGPTIKLAQLLWSSIDVRVVDGAVNGVASMTLAWAGRMRRIQSGQLQHYALLMALGAFVMLTVYLLR